MNDNPPDINRLQWELEALQKKAAEREALNEKRFTELENIVRGMKEERAKLGGAAILLVGLGSILLWLSSVGGNIARVFGK